MRRLALATLLVALALPLAAAPAGARMVVAGRWRILDIVDQDLGKVWPGGGKTIELRPDFTVRDARYEGEAYSADWNLDGETLTVHYAGNEESWVAGDVSLDENGDLNWVYKVTTLNGGRRVTDPQTLEMRLRFLGAAPGEAPGTRPSPGAGGEPSGGASGGGKRRPGGVASAWSAAATDDGGAGEADGDAAAETDATEPDPAETCEGRDADWPAQPAQPEPAQAEPARHVPGGAAAGFPDGGFIFGKGVQLRADPMAESRSLATLRDLDNVQVLGTGPFQRIGKWGRHQWFKVRVDRTGKTGWVFGAFVKPLEVCSE